MWYIANISQQYELWICEKPGIGPKNAISTGNDDNLAILRQFIYGQDMCLIHFIYNQRHHVFSGFGFKRHYLACQQQTYWTAEPTHMRFVYCPTDGITTDQKMINARIIEGCLTLVTNCAPFSWNFWEFYGILINCVLGGVFCPWYSRCYSSPVENGRRTRQHMAKHLRWAVGRFVLFSL